MKAAIVGALLLAGLAGCTEGQREKPSGGYALVGFFGSSGAGPGEFRSPTGIAVGEGGELYVADSGNHRIQVLSSEGAFLREWGESGDAPGQFEKPIDVAIGPEGGSVEGPRLLY